MWVDTPLSSMQQCSTVVQNTSMSLAFTLVHTLVYFYSSYQSNKWLLICNWSLSLTNFLLLNKIKVEMWSELNDSESESVLFIQLKLFSVLHTVPKTDQASSKTRTTAPLYPAWHQKMKTQRNRNLHNTQNYHSEQYPAKCNMFLCSWRMCSHKLGLLFSFKCTLVCRFQSDHFLSSFCDIALQTINTWFCVSYCVLFLFYINMSKNLVGLCP